MSAKYSDCSESQPPSLSQITMRRLGSELAEANSKIQHLLDHCKDAECSICAEIVCKHHEPLHFHHDGCPACEKAMTPEQIGNSWLENSSLEKWFPLTAEELAAARRDISRLTEQLHRANAYWAETDTAIRNALRPVLGPAVDGDSYGVPGLPELVGMLVKQLTAEKP